MCLNDLHYIMCTFSTVCGNILKYVPHKFFLYKHFVMYVPLS